MGSRTVAMNRLDPISLRLFVRVVEQGTIAAAAAAEHLAPAAVSKRLSELESAVGSRLLIRTNKGVEPTDAGQALVALARRVLSELDQIPAQMASYSSGVRGVVRVCASMSAITQFVPEDLKAFRARYPDVQIQLQERISGVVTRAVAEDAADVGIFTAAPHGAQIVSYPIRRDRLGVCVPASHPLASRTALRFDEIVDEAFVGMPSGSAIGLLMERAATQAGRELRPAIQVTSFDAQCMMIASGFGVGVLPDVVAQRNAAVLGIRVLRLDEDWAEREFRVAVRSSGAPSVAADLLVQCLRERGAQTYPGDVGHRLLGD